MVLGVSITHNTPIGVQGKSRGDQDDQVKDSARPHLGVEVVWCDVVRLVGETNLLMWCGVVWCGPLGWGDQLRLTCVVASLPCTSHQW